MSEKKDLKAKRRRSSTSQRLAAMVAGQATHVVRRHRGSSYQTGDESPLIPENFEVVRSKFGQRLRVLDSLVCKVILGVLALLVAYLLFILAFGALNTEDPCVVARRNLEFVEQEKNDRKGIGETFQADLPKIIHQQWKSSKVKNEKYLQWQSRWKELFPEPEYKHILWTDETQRDLIQEHYAWFLPYYDGYKFDIQRADSVRYFIMYHFGGLYADLDYEPLRNFWRHLPKDRVSLIESPYLYNELVQNSLMSSPKHDPFWQHAFKVLVSEFEKPVLSATGPVFLDTTVKTNPEPFHKLPCENFQRIPLGEQENSPWLTLLHREVLGRFFPMKQCGDYKDFTCQLGRHHNTASYLKDTGLYALVFGSTSSQVSDTQKQAAEKAADPKTDDTSSSTTTTNDSP